MAYILPKPITVEDAKIVEEFGKNFSGRVDDMNPHGYKSFLLRIDDPEFAQVLAGDGWNIKHHSSRDGVPTDEYDFLKVNINFNNPRYMPTVVWVTPNANVELDDNSIAQLDKYVFKTMDVKIRPKHYERPTGSGITAYLEVMYVVTEPKPFAGKWERSDGGAIRPNDYAQIAREVHAERDGQVPGGDDLPFEIP